MFFDKLFSSFFRRFSNYIAINTDLYLSHKPDSHTKLNKVEGWNDLYNCWIQNSSRNNKGDLVRLYFLLNQIEYIKTNNVNGSIAEVGVFKGSTAKLFHQNFPNRKIFLFDTFKGFDSRDTSHEKESSGANEGGWTSTIEQVKNFVGESPLVSFIQGYFPDTTASLNSKEVYSLVHLDADLYNPQFSGLEYFYPRVVKGGVIIIHDCNNEYFGSRRALDEFFLNKPETPVIIPDKSGSAVVIKL